MAKLIDRALYKKDRGEPLTRKELKAVAQHENAPRKRIGLSSYKANRSRRIVDFRIDHQRDVLVATKWEPIEAKYTDESPD